MGNQYIDFNFFISFDLFKVDILKDSTKSARRKKLNSVLLLVLRGLDTSAFTTSAPTTSAPSAPFGKDTSAPCQDTSAPREKTLRPLLKDTSAPRQRHNVLAALAYLISPKRISSFDHSSVGNALKLTGLMI